ncbi:MAG: 50S ribosomal protein L5 [Pirellulaceae bacterium]|nr:50S ribosomal protein L5 [Pirellulaceae bacterium]
MAELPENYEARLRTLYRESIVPVLREQTGRANLMSLPKLDKIIINMGVGSAVTDKKNIEDAQAAMTLIAGQKAMVTLARQSIANFRLRQGMPIGVKVTLRGNRMYEFLDRLITFVLPRVRDFRGVSEKAFDGNGNYSMSLTEYLVFPELNPDKFTRKQGMNICLVTSARNDVEGRLLLEQFGIPFRRRKPESGKVGAGAE